MVVDLDYVRRSPPTSSARAGDALSNLSALADWELAHRERGEPMDGLAAALARAGAESLLRRTDDLESEDFLTALAEALILGGLAMAAAEAAGRAAGRATRSHMRSTRSTPTREVGAQVAVGALFASFLREDGLVEPLDAALSRYGVPRPPRDLGLSNDQFTAAVVHAPSTRPDRYTILEHLDLNESETGGGSRPSSRLDR